MTFWGTFCPQGAGCDLLYITWMMVPYKYRFMSTFWLILWIWVQVEPTFIVSPSHREWEILEVVGGVADSSPIPVLILRCQNAFLATCSHNSLLILFQSSWLLTLTSRLWPCLSWLWTYHYQNNSVFVTPWNLTQLTETSLKFQGHPWNFNKKTSYWWLGERH